MSDNSFYGSEEGRSRKEVTRPDRANDSIVRSWENGRDGSNLVEGRGTVVVPEGRVSLQLRDHRDDVIDLRDAEILAALLDGLPNEFIASVSRGSPAAIGRHLDPDIASPAQHIRGECQLQDDAHAKCGGGRPSPTSGQSPDQEPANDT